MLIALCICCATAGAQINDPRKVKLTQTAPTKSVSMKSDTAIKSTILRNSGAQPAPKPEAKPFDLLVSQLTVTGKKNAQGSYDLVINYTITNADTGAVSLGDVQLQGYYGSNPSNGVPFKPGCGALAGLPYAMLNPGQTHSGTFYCSVLTMPASGQPVYQLGISLPTGSRAVDAARSSKTVVIGW